MKLPIDLAILRITLLVAGLTLAHSGLAEAEAEAVIDVAPTAGKSADNEPSPTQVNSEPGAVGKTVVPGADSSGTNAAGTTARSNTLGDAFKNFQPSEEISADNPVPFPVDI